jgi:predicted amidophosphoribosyltransferase
MAEKYKLLWAASTVFTCAQCHCWVVRSPGFMGDSDIEGFQCEQCGATSVHIRDGRPFGPKSAQWADVVSLWEQYQDFAIEMIDAFEWHNIVKTEPPLVRPNIA